MSEPASHPPVDPAFLAGLRGWWTRQLARLHWRLFSEHWRIGLIDRPIGQVIASDAPPRIRWITPRESAGYWADPFGLPGSDRLVYCERLDEVSGVGRLEVMELRGGRLRWLRPLDARVGECRRVPVGDGLHASFPHVFELDGELRALAETSAAMRLTLYRVTPEGEWHSPVDLPFTVQAADPVLWRQDGRYWLAYTDVARGPQDHLLLYHAEALDGPWHAHAANPVRTGLAGSRMAGGMFMHDGRLHRPAQDCSGTYGGAVIVYRVEECTPDRYVETPVRVLAPAAGGPLPHGLHTLSAWGDRTLVDGKRIVVNPVAVWRKMKRRRSA